MTTILHLRSANIFGSPERLIIGQCRHLKEFSFVCASYVRGDTENRFLGECTSAGLTTGVLRESFTGDYRVVRQIRELVTQHQVALLVTHDYKSNFFGRLAARRDDLPQVAYFHGITAEDTKVALYNSIDRFMIRKMAKVITVSSLTSRFLQSRGLPPQRIEVVPNAVDPATFLKEPLPPHGDDRPARLIGVGRFSSEKGFDILLKAVAKIKPEAPPFELLLYGLGPEEKRLREMVSRLGLTEIVRFCGFVDDILPVLRGVDFMVMSSRSEGMPVVILEAWSQQVGVLASSVGGIPEMIEPGKNGLLVPPENVSELAGRILWGLNHRDQMRRYGRAGFETLQKKYTFPVQARRLAAIYSGVIDRKKRPQSSKRSARS